MVITIMMIIIILIQIIYINTVSPMNMYLLSTMQVLWWI